MKKIVLLLTAIFMLNLSASAEITTEEALSPAYLHNHGFSKEAIRLIDLQQAQINGTKPMYKNLEPDWYTSNKAVKFVRDAFIYIDPALDNDLFMIEDIDPSTRWDDI